MLYTAYDVRARLMAPLYGLAGHVAAGSDRLPAPVARWSLASSEVVSALRLTHERPEFGIDGVTEEAVLETPFATLLHFAKPTSDPQPKVLIVAGLAGHFATL